MMEETEEKRMLSPKAFFPLATMREKQDKALDFVERAFNRGYRDIVIAAPTGVGKSFCGAAVCFWAGQPISESREGGYYLVTQKLLQDQLTRDIPLFQPHLRSAASIKSATEYACEAYTTCFVGRRAAKGARCPELQAGRCTYALQKSAWAASQLAITNYPWFFSSLAYTEDIIKRRVLICDECHSLERQILNFVELVLDKEVINNFCPSVRPIPEMDTLEEFCGHLRIRVLPVCEAFLEDLRLKMMTNRRDVKSQADFAKLENWINRTKAGIEDAETSPDNWVYWQEIEQGKVESSIAKPLSAAPFYDGLIGQAADLRIFMSAYPGPKSVFCRSLGIDPDGVAWLNLSSTFPVEHRPLHLLLLGSMSLKNMEHTLPSLCRQCERIISAHPNEKGVLHCNSYKLGDRLFEFLSGTAAAAPRLIYPRNARERDLAFDRHVRSPSPTVLLSPSMTEGFDMKDDISRWQIIAKIAWPYLGDKQVFAKKERDPEWYVMQAVMTLIQAVGRNTRSEKDTGITYLLDSDFLKLYEHHRDFFPRWFTESFVWHNR